MYTDGYDDKGDYYSAECEDDEMPATERELAEDAQWKVIQKNTFTRWTNEHLKQANKSIASLEFDLSDGLRLCALIEVLSGKKFKRINKRPNFRSQKLENVTTALKLLEEDEGIKIVNIDSTDIVDSKLKLILGLIWTLILHYSISMPMWEGEEDLPASSAKEGPTPKQRLLIWVQNKLPEVPVRNFTTDWNDGKAIGALVDAVGPGLCPDWEDWDPNSGKKNATEAMDLAEQWLEVPQLIKPDEMVNPKVDELSMMTYLSQFPNAKLKAGAPLRPRTNPARVRAYGPGLEKVGNCKGRPANFKIDTFAGGKGQPAVVVTNPSSKQEKCEVVFNNDRNLTYSCSYTPSMEGQYTVTISFSGKEIPKSPYSVKVEGAAGDPEKVTAEGPGLQASGVQAGKKTYFEVFTEGAIEGAGVGNVEVIIVDSHGHKDTCKPRVSKSSDATYYVEYMAKEIGRYSVHIYFAGKEIPYSPYTVMIGAPVEPKKAYATGRGVQAKGVRVQDVADIMVHTAAAGTAELTGTLVGPTGTEEPLRFRKIDANTYETSYKPTKPGNYTVNLQYGPGHIAKSPFKVAVGPYKESKIRAYGPGLEGGIVGKPADFVVETNGETGALGFAIEGPSQAKIQCSDNGDGSADVTYQPTVPGEYAVHVLCDNEDIPNSPFMAMIAPAMPQGNSDMVVASGPGLEKNGVTQGKPAVFTVDTSKAGNAPLKVYGQDQNGKPINVQTKDNGDGTFNCQYNPKEPIKHTVFITFGGVNVPKSPFRVYVEEPAMPEKVKVFGPGIEKGVTCSESTHFFVDCTEAGPGDVAISLTDDKGVDVPVDADDNGEGLFRIEYEPKSFGTYTVNVIFADQEIPTSPYYVKIEPSIDVSGVKVVGLEKGLTINKLTRFQVKDGSKVRKLFVSVVIQSPSGKMLNPMINKVSDGANVSFTPREVGEYSIEVYANGKHITDSPFRVHAVSDGSPPAPKQTEPPRIKFANANQVKQPEAKKGKPWSRKPSDNLSGTEETSNKPKGKKSPADKPDGKLGKFGKPKDETPEWMNPSLKGFQKKAPTEAAEEDAPKLKPWQKKKPGEEAKPQEKQPDNAAVEDKTEPSKLKPWQKGRKDNIASKVKVFGAGITTGNCAEVCKFTVDTSAAGPGELAFAISGPGNVKLMPKDIGSGQCEVSYTPSVPGVYSIEVTYGKVLVPGAPFKPTIKAGLHKKGSEAVKVYGDGIVAGEVNKPSTFVVDTTLSGPGKLAFNIRGPSKPKISTKDVERGKCEVTYVPTLVGTYTVDVTYNGESVAGAPFKPLIKRAGTTDSNAKVKVYGDGLVVGETKKPNAFVVDTTDAGPGKLGFDIRGPSKPQITTKDLEPGKCEVTYIPTLTGIYVIDVTYNGRSVPEAPFQASVKQSSEPTNRRGSVKVSGDGLVTGEVKKPNTFVIDMTEAGPGKLDFDITGPLKPKITTRDIEAKVIEVTYTPMLSGSYSIVVRHGGKHIAGSPFKPSVKQGRKTVNPVDKVTVYGEGITRCKANKPNTFTVDTTASGPGKVSVDIAGPSKPKITTKEVETGKCEVTYIPTIAGSYVIDVKYDGGSVPGSPFKPTLDTLASEPAGAVEKVKVYGDGVVIGEINKPNTFVVDTQEAGPGKLGFDVRGPSKPKLSTTDLGEGRCEVTYIPTLAGTYTVDITYNGKQIPGAPFKPNITRATKAKAVVEETTEDVTKVKVSGAGIQEGEINKPNTFIVDTFEAGPGKLGFDVRGPSKPKLSTKDLGEGRCEVTYIPTLAGTYTIDVTYNGKKVHGAPFKPNITQAANTKAATEETVADVTKVRVYGDGVLVGEINQPNTFIVDTHEAGPGKLAFDVRGPSKPKLSTTDAGNGKCEVTYVPTLAGTYTVDITYNGKQVPGAPFKPNITRATKAKAVVEETTGDVTKVKVSGAGIRDGEINKPNTFIVDTFEAGPGKLGFDVRGPSKPTLSTKEVGKGRCELTYVPTLVGTYTVDVTYDGKQIPGAPFKPNITHATKSETNAEETVADVTKVQVYGDGVLKGEMNKPNTFIVDTHEAGPGKLYFDVKGPSKPKMSTKDLGKGKCEVTYIPTVVGTYTVDVTYNGKQVPGTPFKPSVTHPTKPTAQDMVKVHGDGIKTGVVNMPSVFIVDTTAAGSAKLGFNIQGASKPKVTTKDLGVGKCEVTYTPTVVGTYNVDVTYDGKSITKTPYEVKVEPLSDSNLAGNVTVCGDGVVTGTVGQPNTFIVDTTKSGPGKLSFDIVGPSKPTITTKDLGNGRCEVSYLVDTAGHYDVCATFNDQPISNSPFKVTIDLPPDQALSIKEAPMQHASLVKVYGEGITTGELGAPCRFVVDTSQSKPGELGFDIKGPGKATITTQDIGNGKCEVTYTPTETGLHIIDVTYNQQPVPGSPFTSLVNPGKGKAHISDKVKIYGDGLKLGETNKCCSFVIDTSDSGPGKLAFDIRGPSKASMDVKEISPGKCEVSYVPTQAGIYYLDVYFDNTKLAGSPFSVEVTPSQGDDSVIPEQSTVAQQLSQPSDSFAPVVESSCPVTGVALSRATSGPAVCNLPVTQTVDIRKCGVGKLGFNLQGPAKAELHTQEIEAGVYEVSYVPTVCGDYALGITYNDVSLSTSPVSTKVLSNDAVTDESSSKRLQGYQKQCPETNVILSSDCLDSGKCNECQRFVVDTSVSGPGKLAFEVSGPSKLELTTKSLAHDKCEVSYTPTKVGTYILNVLFNEKPLSICPLHVGILQQKSDGFAPTATPTAKKVPLANVSVAEEQTLKCSQTDVKLSGCINKPTLCNEPAKIIVDLVDSGPGRLGCSIRGPAKADLSTVDIGGGKCEVSCTPTVPGEYVLDITFNEQPLSISPVNIRVIPTDAASEVEQVLSSPIVEFAEDIPEKMCQDTGVTIRGNGINVGRCNEVSTFNVNTENAGVGELSFKVNGPGTADVVSKCIGLNIYEVSYAPSAAGTYTIDMFYGDKQAFGGPLVVTVSPSELNLSSTREPYHGVTNYNEEFTENTTDDGFIKSTVATATKTQEFKFGNTVRQEKCVTSTIMSTVHTDSPNLQGHELSQLLTSSENTSAIIDESSPTVQSVAIEEVISSPEQTTQAAPSQLASKPTVDLIGAVEDVNVLFPLDTHSQQVAEDQITATKKESVYATDVVDRIDNSEFTLSSQAAPEQIGTEDVESCFTISADTVVEDSYSVTDHRSAAAPPSTTFNMGDLVIQSSSDVTEQSFSATTSPPTNTTTEQVESCFTISADAVIEDSYKSSQIDTVGSQDFSTETEPLNIFASKPEQIPVTTEDTVAQIETTHQEQQGATAKVLVTGDGLSRTVIHTTEKFVVDMGNSGPGNLNFSVKGPAKPQLLVKDIGDNRCEVTFIPQEMGSYVIDMLYNGEHIPGSPFTTHVTSRKDLDVTTVKLPRQEKTDVFLDSTTDFVVDASSVTPNGEGTVKAIVTSPSGAKNETRVTNNEDGTYQVAYAPYEEGPHQIDVSYEGLPIPGSPLEVDVVPGNDPTRVKAYGPGLEKGLTNVPQQFTIETKGAGQGGLALAVEGPSKAQVNCTDNHDGTCSVDYTPTKPGDYDISVKFDGENIPGSPFRVPVEDVVDASKVKMYGPGLNPEGVRATQPAPFTIDCKDAGKAPLKATVDDGSGIAKPVEMVEVDDGVYECTYYPTTEGAPCKLDVTYDDEHVPGSPFEQTVLPAHDASLVTVSGPGIEDGVPASLPTEFTIDTSKAGVADLDVAVQAPDGRYLRPTITDNKDATVTVHYTPDDVGVYNAKVKYGGDQIPGSPFDVNTRPTGDASKCQITEGKKRVVVDEECVITVNTADAGLGNITCRIRTPTDTDADIDIVDNNDGTVSIFYTPHTPGSYGISIKFGGVPIPEGDYEVEAVPEELFAIDEADIIPVQKVNEQHSAPPMMGNGYPNTFHPVDFVIPVGPIFAYVLAEVEAPSGKRSPVKIKDNGDGTVTINYQPTEVGLHNLHVLYNDEPLEGSPYQFHVDEVDSPVVAAYGPGLSYGVAAEPCSFTIDTKNSGAGGLSLAVEGPSKAEIVCQDNDDGTCTVTYLPTEPGLYNIVVKFDDEHIMGSPFTAYIAGEANKEKAQLSMGQASEFSLSVEEYDINELEADITAPSGKSEPCILKKLPNGHLGISFTPHETGTHLVNVYKDGQHIANSPFKINVTRNEVGNADKVKVYGDGLTSGTANDVNEFYVDTKDAGYGGLSLSIEGPSKADIECKDRPDGSTAVNYKPTQPGTYVISIKFADEHVPGSPFNCKVGGTTGINEESMLTAQQKAADVTHVGSVCELSLKVPGSDPMEMVASVTSPSGITELCDVMDSSEDHYTIQFVPKEMGPHIVSVKHKGLSIPGSPFQFTVGPITEGGAHKVHASGPGLERGEVNCANEFNIYTREAGSGGLAISVEGPSKADIKFEDKHDGSSVVSYKCADPGEYVVSVKFNDEHIPDSPFRVPLLPSSGDARKVTVQSLKQKGLEIGKPASFTCMFNGAKGELFAKVVAPSGAEDEALCQPLDDTDSHYAIRFIPRENGVHFVHVTLDRCHIRGSPFKAIVGEQEPDPGVVTASGSGLKTAETGKNNKFTVHTVGAGSSSLAVTIDGPSKAKLDAKEIADGYEFSYNPSAPGTYYITMKYGGNHHIAGSPFKVKCTGSGQPGQNQSAHCVIETEKKTEADLANAMPKFNSDGSKVTSKGHGLTKAFVNKKAQFTVDSSTAGQNMLFVGMIGPANSPPVDEILIKHAQRNTYNVAYTVKQKGKYHLLVKWGDDHIPGSPFNIDVV